MSSSCPLCGSSRVEVLFRYDAPPPGETRFELAGRPYERLIRRCQNCGHMTSHHDLDLADLYDGTYMDTTYGDRLASTYERIMSLPPERSDNVARVERIVAELGSNAPDGPPSVLDVGSGLGVFPARMKVAGWECTALDPDPRAVAHLRERVGVEAVEADFMEVEALGDFDLITFNKVLEHVTDPVAMLARAVRFLGSGGAVYVEVPDGELAAAEGPDREELFIEHHHAFSFASLGLLAMRAGFTIRRCERLREPSDKLTLFAFLAPTS
jgi:SAM-dependent methyltransferase